MSEIMTFSCFMERGHVIEQLAVLFAL